MTNLIHINQYITSKQNLEKKNEDVDKKKTGASRLETTTAFN